jgi:hypothetical protein
MGLLAALLAIAATAFGETTHTYPVTVTIAVDRAAHKVGGEVLSEAPAQFCEMSTVRVLRVMPGKDKVVARIFPSDISQWSMKSPPALRGARVYAETSAYQLPSRPVVCLAGRSRTVTAP